MYERNLKREKQDMAKLRLWMFLSCLLSEDTLSMYTKVYHFKKKSAYCQILCVRVV